MKLHLKRAYEPAAPEDGKRFLVDRLWPRGVKKEALVLTDWLKNVAPSDALRRWFGHDLERWTEFRRRYRSELGDRKDEIATLRRRGGNEPVTLLYGARDEAHNQAVVLKEFIEETN